MKEKIINVINNINEKVNGLKFRERLLVTVALVFTMYFFTDTYINEYFTLTKSNLERKKESTIAEMSKMQNQYDEILKTVDKSKVTDLTSRIDKLKNLTRSLESEIVKYTRKLIPPKEMVNLLQDILTKDYAVKVVGLTNLSESSIFRSLDEEESGGSDNMDIYKHGIQIELEGKFFDVMEFLYKLEQLKWNIIWDQLHYEVVEHPIANVKIVIYTLSLSSSWLGF